MRTIYLFISSLFSIFAAAQTSVAEWSEAVNKFGTSLPQEKVFVHTDNQCYFLGDTIFYRAYLTRSDTKRPSGLSGVLYVELLNGDGYLMERQQVEMKGGMGTGTIVLDTTTCRYAGYYELRAYTRWQLNFGATTYEHSKWSEKWFFNKGMAKSYYRDYEKLYSRILPVYDYPMSPGDYTRDMTERPLQRYFKAEDKQNPTPDVKLYPEGGTLTAGAPCRMAFEALTGDGRHLRGTLRVTTADGTLVAEAQTQSRGRGVVAFTPQAATKYRCSFTYGEETHKVDMPKIASEGVSLMASISENALDIKATPMTLPLDKEVGMTIMNCGTVVRAINLSQEGWQHTIPLSELPVGVLDITVFNDEGRIFADRLLFNTGEPGALAANTITITGAGTQAAAYKPVTLNLRSGAGKKGIVSVAVMDAATTDYTYDSGTILTEMLLSSEIRGFVEDPAYYFEENDDTHRQALDLLMMVQGWRRFDWKIMAAPQRSGFAITHPYERQTPIMSGLVNKYKVDAPEDRFLEMAMEDADNYMESNAGNPWAEEEEEETETTATSGMEDLQAAVQDNVAQLKQDAEKADERFDENYGNLKREVTVHAEFAQPGSAPLLGEMMTDKGRFKITSPVFDGECYFFLAASDTTRWGKKGHTWVQVNKDNVDKREYPEFYVYLEQPYPRFSHPYTFYQTAPAEGRISAKNTVQGVFDDRQLAQVTVRVRHNGKRAFDKRYPAITVDALEAFNHAIDAGLCTGQYIGWKRFCNDVARAYIGDMGEERQYILQIRWDGKNSSSLMSDATLNKYNDIAILDKVSIYTDFAPRHVGDSRWHGSNQPTVIVNLMSIPDNGKRVTYRDRRLILQGFSICEDFYNPDYSKMPLPQNPDYRRTLYWNPALVLDEQGEASVTFYRNARQGEVAVTVNGFSADGAPLSGESR